MQSIIEELTKGHKRGHVVFDFMAAYLREEPEQEMPDPWLHSYQRRFSFQDFLEVELALEDILDGETVTQTITSYKGTTPLELPVFDEEEFLKSTKVTHNYKEALMTSDEEVIGLSNGYELEASFSRAEPRTIIVRGRNVPTQFLTRINSALQIYQPLESRIEFDYE